MSECNLEIKFSAIVFLVLICGCFTPKQKEEIADAAADAAAGAAEGAKVALDAVGDALTAWETTGLTGAALVLGIGVWKAISKGRAKAATRKAERDAAAPRQG